jgi:hypothetical protein
VSFELTIAGVSAITDADLTKYKVAIAATIENVDPSQIEITANSARLRRLTDSVVLEVTTSSPTAEIADLVENALSATNFASELSTELSTRSITASLTIDATTISKTNPNTTGVFASDESPSESDGISTGVIVGIAIGILVFVAIIAMFACKPSKKSNVGTPEAGSVAQTKVVVAQQPESNV